jgi:hypothetical protein
VSPAWTDGGTGMVVPAPRNPSEVEWGGVEWSGAEERASEGESEGMRAGKQAGRGT